MYLKTFPFNFLPSRAFFPSFSTEPPFINSFFPSFPFLCSYLSCFSSTQSYFPLFLPFPFNFIPSTAIFLFFFHFFPSQLFSSPPPLTLLPSLPPQLHQGPDRLGVGYSQVLGGGPGRCISSHTHTDPTSTPLRSPPVLAASATWLFYGPSGVPG